MDNVFDPYKDELYISLRKLEAANLYFSIILKKQLTRNLKDSDSAFIALNGNHDVDVLENMYIKQKFLDLDISILSFLHETQNCYEILKNSYLSNEVIRKTAIIQYESFQNHFLNNMSLEESTSFLTDTVDQYFYKETGLFFNKRHEISKIKVYDTVK